MDIILKPDFTQEDFNEAVDKIKIEVIDKHSECTISVITLDNEDITLVEGYWDMSDYGPEPCFWYHKVQLDRRGIKYGLSRNNGD